MNRLLRNHKPIYFKEDFREDVNPDMFFINKTSYKHEFIKDYQPCFSLINDFYKEMETLLGFHLYVNQSKIYHQDSGEGVFLSCKRKNVLPGTIIGFYPGVIYSDLSDYPFKNFNDVYPFLKRSDNFWVDPNGLIPYPNYFMNCLHDFRVFLEREKLVGNNIFYKEVPTFLLNPLSLGNKINHCPPNVSSNVKFVDIHIPCNFLPDNFHRFFPNYQNDDSFRYTKSFKNCYKFIGIMTLREINHNEELYLDYM